MILLSIPSIWSSRSMSSFAYRRSRDRSHDHHIMTMKMVTGMVMTKYIQRVGYIWKVPSVACVSHAPLSSCKVGPVTILERREQEALELNLPSVLLKNTMLKTEDNSVAGRKMVPRREMVFIDVLSRLPAWARRRWSAAICRLSFDSFWAIMLYNCLLSV